MHSRLTAYAVWDAHDRTEKKNSEEPNRTKSNDEYGGNSKVGGPR